MHTSCYPPAVAKRFGWSEEKNLRLQRERGIGFEEIVFHIEKGDLLDRLEQPQPERFGQQRIFVVRVGDYAYLVPYVESAGEIYLKTIIPSRKATRDYLGEGGKPP